MRSLELRRHAHNDGDRLTDEGRALAHEVGREMAERYDAIFSSPAKRAAETAAWFLRGRGHRLPPSHAVTEGLASSAEDRWRNAARASGTGRIDDIEGQDPDLVAEEAPRLAGAMREMLAAVPEGGRGLAVGHSPFLEAGVYGLTGSVIEPLGKCEGVLLVEEGDAVRVANEYRREG